MKIYFGILLYILLYIISFIVLIVFVIFQCLLFFIPSIKKFGIELEDFFMRQLNALSNSLDNKNKIK